MRSLFRTMLSLSFVHWLTSVGFVLTTASAVVFLALIFQSSTNPYFGIVVFIVIPALFVLGLLLMPVGYFLAGRPRAPLEGSRVSRLAWAFAFATLANAGIIGLAPYPSVGYMDSKGFCGTTCHSVIQPP